MNGLSNAPSEFMRVMSNLLKEHVQAGYCVVFIDDILVFSQDLVHDVKYLEKVLETIWKAGYRLKPDKCSFANPLADSLGFSVDGDGVQMLLQKVDAICSWPLPLTPKEMRSFVGLAGVYRKFIPQFSQIALRLLDLISQSKSQYSTSIVDARIENAVHNSMSIIQSVIMSAPALALPEKGNHEFIVRTDVSGFAIGATLRQFLWDKDAGSFSRERILGYFSHKLSGPETCYLTYDQELLAVKDAIEHWRYYHHGAHFVVQTDHSSLRHVLKQPKLSSKQMRLLERLQEYDFNIEFLPCTQNFIQDMLSPRPDYKDPPFRTSTITKRSGTIKKEACADLGLELFTLMTVDADGWLQEVQAGYKEDGYFAEVLLPIGERGENLNEVRR